MKITVYSTTDCKFCKEEKDYLVANKLPYEEKSLESNREFLTEMLAVSNNFAGTPVTKIEKDDGQIAVLKGFTKEEFDVVLGLVKPQSTPVEVNAGVTVPPPVAVAPSTPQPAPVSAPPEPVAPTPEPVSPAPVQTPTPTVEPTVQTPVQPDPLNAILNDLQNKSTEPQATPPPPPAAPPQTPQALGALPPIPDFKSP